MANERDDRPLRRDPRPPDARGGGALLPGSVHARRDRGDGASLAGSEAAGRAAAVPRGGEAGGRLDDDGDASSALAPPRRGRLPAGSGSTEATSRSDRLTIAIPAKGRLREPTVALLEDAGLGPEQPGQPAL